MWLNEVFCKVKVKDVQKKKGSWEVNKADSKQLISWEAETEMRVKQMNTETLIKGWQIEKDKAKMSKGKTVWGPEERRERDRMYKQTRKTELERDKRCADTGNGADQQGPRLSAVSQRIWLWQRNHVYGARRWMHANDTLKTKFI